MLPIPRSNFRTRKEVLESDVPINPIPSAILRAFNLS